MTERCLLDNIIEQIQELQLKLGYAKETVRLYYPLASLNGLLSADAKTNEEMLELLQKNPVLKESPAGPFAFAVSGGRLEISVPPEGVTYIHEHLPVPAFLKDMIWLFQEHHACTVEQIQELFARYSKHYICRKMPEGSDFDYVMYFEDPSIDGYYYCIKSEMGHTIYHRFTKEDYKALL